MHLSDILRAVPESAIKTQRLEVCALRAQAKKKPSPHTDVTFSTQGYSVRDLMFPQESENVGLIVWINRKEWDKVFASVPGGEPQGSSVATTDGQRGETKGETT